MSGGLVSDERPCPGLRDGRPSACFSPYLMPGSRAAQRRERLELSGADFWRPLERFVSDLKLKSYAKRSIHSYQRAVRQLHSFNQGTQHQNSELEKIQISLCPPPPGPSGTGPSYLSGIASGGTGSTPSHCPGNAMMRIAKVRAKTID